MTYESLHALRRAKARPEPIAIEALRARIDTSADPVAAPRSHRRGLVGASLAGVSVAVAALTVALLVTGSGSSDARAAVRKAATVTAASADGSGTATVRITHDGELWAAKRISWNGNDLSVADTSPGRDGRAGGEMRVVDGMMYAPDPRGHGWIELGPPESVDPDSGTTPAEYLAAVREDVGGETLRRITDGITGLGTQRLADGSTVYAGTVAAGLIARELGFKEGQAIRVLPFGYVAHDQGADPTAPIQVAVTVDAGGVVRELAVSWGTWRYTVGYSSLGTTPAPVAPANARGLGR